MRSGIGSAMRAGMARYCTCAPSASAPMHRSCSQKLNVSAPARAAAPAHEVGDDGHARADGRVGDTRAQLRRSCRRTRAPSPGASSRRGAGPGRSVRSEPHTPTRWTFEQRLARPGRRPLGAVDDQPARFHEGDPQHRLGHRLRSPHGLDAQEPAEQLQRVRDLRVVDQDAVVDDPVARPSSFPSPPRRSPAPSRRRRGRTGGCPRSCPLPKNIVNSPSYSTMRAQVTGPSFSRNSSAPWQVGHHWIIRSLRTRRAALEGARRLGAALPQCQASHTFGSVGCRSVQSMKSGGVMPSPARVQRPHRGRAVHVDLARRDHALLVEASEHRAHRHVQPLLHPGPAVDREARHVQLLRDAQVARPRSARCG